MNWFRDLRLSIKINLLVTIAALVLGVVIVFLIATSTRLLLTQVGNAELTDEVAILQANLENTQNDLAQITTFLVNDPNFVAAVQAESQTEIARVLQADLQTFAFDEFDVVNAEGERITDLAEEDEEGGEGAEDALIDQALLGIERVTFLLETEDGESEALFVYVRPVRDANAQIVGAVLTGTRIDNTLLNEYSFGRDNISLHFVVDGEVLSQTTTEDGTEAETFEVDQTFVQQALIGEPVINTFVRFPAVRNLRTEGFVPVQAVNDLAPQAVIAINLAQEEIVFFQSQILTNVAIALLIALSGIILTTILFSRLAVGNPMNRLQESAKRLAEGDLSQRALVRSKDEIGQLAQSLNDMATAVEDRNTSLATLTSSLEGQNANLATASEIAAAANQIRERDELLSLTVNLIRDRFDFYYVQAYTVDEDKQFAVLTEGTGYAGRQLLGRNHKLPLNGQSLVANTINTGEAIVVQDTATNEQWLPNDLLPDTRSEIVIPLIANNEVIGALDIQHKVANTFDESQQQLFQTLANQLSTTFENIALLDSAEDRARQIATVAQVGIEAATERDLATMLRSASQLTRDNFGLYHAHVYLVNEEANLAELMAGAGEAGAMMVANKHSISLSNEQSLVVQAIDIKQSVIVNDVTEAEQYLPNPLLPNTRAEMAIPMIVGERVVGVLDVQSAGVGRFSAEDAQVLQTLASQLAVATDNIQTLQDVREAQEFLRTVADSTPAWIFVKDRSHRYTFVNEPFAKSLGLTPDEMIGKDDLQVGFPEEVVLGNPEKDIVGFWVDDDKVLNEGIQIRNPYDPAVIADGSTIVLDTSKLPMRNSADEIIGVLGIAVDVTERNAQEADIRRRATRMEAATEISSSIANILDEEELLWAVSNLANERLNHYHTQVYLLDEASDSLKLAAGSGDVGKRMVDEQHAIPSSADSLVARAARTKSLVLVNNVDEAEDYQFNPNLPDTHAELVVPILYGDSVVGVLDIQDSKYDAFGEVEMQVKQTLANQIAIAIQNARQYQQTQAGLKETDRRAKKMQAVTEISSEIADILDIEQLLYDFSNLANEKLSHYHTQVYLLSPDGQHLMLRAGSGDVGVDMVHMGHSIPVEADSLVARAARERDVVVVNDIYNVADYLPNPNLPYTASEIAVPITYAGETIGVLDIQDENINAFGDMEVQVKRTLANQLSVALQNARQFEQTQVRLQEVLATNAVADFVREDIGLDIMLENILTIAYNTLGATNATLSTYDADANQWQGVVAAGDNITTELAKTFVDIGERYPHGLAALEKEQPEFVPNARTYPDFPMDFVDAMGIKSVLVIPLIVNNLPYGVIFLNYVADYRQVDENDLRLAMSIGNQVTNGIERTQAREQIQQQTAIAERRAAELETVANVSAAATTILDVDELLQSVVDLAKTNFDLYHAHIYLYESEQNNLVLAAGAGDAGQMMKERGHSIDFDNLTGLVPRAARNQEVVIINDTVNSPDFLPNPLLPDTKSEMAIPMTVGEDLIGVLDIQSDEFDYFTDADARTQGTLAAQIAVAIRNAQAFERERKTVERLREVDRLKQEFLANMSHELRTPLNSIIGYSEVLIDGVDGDLTDDAMEDVEAIHTSGKHLLSIINEILDLAKIDAGQMQLSRDEKDLVEILNHIVVSSQVLVKDKPVDVVLVEGSPIEMTYIDPVRINQIMLNLVGNAIKFTEEGVIKVRYSMVDNDYISVEIADTGMGMNDEQLALIFQRFRQVDGSSTRRAGGTGLGLTITKQLVEMHGGEIGVTSEVGVGSTFYFTLPKASLAKAQEAAEQDVIEDEISAEPVGD